MSTNRTVKPAGPRFFKAVATDGTDFLTETVPWLPADGAPIPAGGWVVEHPNPGEVGSWDASGYLSASTAETDRTGFQRPGRLLSVEPVGAMWTPYPDSFPRVRAAHAWRVIGELPAWRVFGPQGRQVLDIIEQASHLTSTQVEDLAAAWRAAQDSDQGAALVAARDTAHDASQGAAQDAARHAALDAARHTARHADRGTAHTAWNAGWDVVLGLLAKDSIPVEDFRALTGPWESVMGRSWEVTA